MQSSQPGPLQDRAHPADLPSPGAILGRAAAENFPVASRLLPGGLRQHLMALYGYARLTDYLGDEYPGDRLAALDWLQADLEDALHRPAGPGAHHPLVSSVAASVTELGLAPGPLFDLIEANRLDQAVSCYKTFDDLVDYCRLSANPVGRLVLGILGVANPQREVWSDSICTGLQLAEHWQDVAEDAAAGRTYLPQEDLDRFGIHPGELTAGPPRPQLRALMAFQVARTRRLLDEGCPLVGALSGRSRVAVAGFVAGGHAALDAVAAADFDPFRDATRPSPWRASRHLRRIWRGAGVRG